MRFGNLGGRACIISDEGMVDIEAASGGRFPSDPAAVFPVWTELATWVKSGVSAKAAAFDTKNLRSPSPKPTQVFAVGLNYLDHAMEAGLKDAPSSPAVFTKFQTCITGPEPRLQLPSENVDWEIELVAVIGKPVYKVGPAAALDHVAGLAVGQDYSERVVQLAGASPQFSLGKSFPGFGPVGPWLVSLDEIDDPSDLAIRCEINGEVMQSSRTSKMIFPLPEIISRLSDVTRLLPGDIIFTGTPSGVGGARDPKIFLKPGDTVVSTIEGIGSFSQICE